MADGRFKEAAEFYEPLVQSKLELLLSIPAIVLANLCVCYIMTSQNDQAEALMRQVERQEQQQATAVRPKPSFLPLHTGSITYVGILRRRILTVLTMFAALKSLTSLVPQPVNCQCTCSVDVSRRQLPAKPACSIY